MNVYCAKAVDRCCLIQCPSVAIARYFEKTTLASHRNAQVCLVGRRVVVTTIYPETIVGGYLCTVGKGMIHDARLFSGHLPDIWAEVGAWSSCIKFNGSGNEMMTQTRRLTVQRAMISRHPRPN